MFEFAAVSFVFHRRKDLSLSVCNPFNGIESNVKNQHALFCHTLTNSGPFFRLCVFQLNKVNHMKSLI